MMRYVDRISFIIVSTYPILLQLANALPRKTVVDLSRGSRKQLRKTTKAQAGPSTSTSKRARTTMNNTPNEGESVPGGVQVSCNSSLISVESLVRKVSNISYHSLIHLTRMYSQRENETRSIISMKLSPQTHVEKLVIPVTGTTSAITEITRLSR